MNKFIYNNSGNILVLFAIFLPILLAFFLLVIDSGNINIKTAELQTISNSAAEYGLTIVSDKIVELAEARCAPECSNQNPVIYLEDEDYTYLLSQNFSKEIMSHVKNFILSQSATAKITSDQIEIIYPYQYTRSSKKIMIYVSLQDNAQIYFNNFFSTEAQTIKKETAAFLPLSV